MPFATVNGLSLSYELRGDRGEPLVFLHGFTGDSTDWHSQIEEFAGDYQILVFDNRGHGQSEAPEDTEAYSVDLMMDDALALIAHVGFSRYHLVGHSMGGAIAQEIALRNSEQLHSLTLNDTSHSFRDHDEPGGTKPYVPPEQVKMAMARVAKMSKDALPGAWKGLIGWRGSTDRAHEINTPTLIIYGDRDASRIIEGSRRLKELIPHANVAPIAGAGHSPQRECTDDYNRVLREFLEDNHG